MAGKRGRSGRKPQADVLKIANGTYRADRDGDPEAKPQANGIPERPTLSLPEARAFWDRYVPMLVEMQIAKAADAPRLQMMAEAWALMRRAAKAANADPLDKIARTAYAEYSRLFASVAAEFGMTPSDRARLIVDKPRKPTIQGRARG